MVLVLIVVDDRTVWVDLLVYATVAITVASGAGYFFRLQRAQARRA
jgi:CDP-diacylglycerol--glycerol-3-phosphate 3-phosphatidyltransferase